MTPFRVGGQTCASIFTTRLNDVALAIAPTASDIYRLPVLTDQAAFELLARLAPETTSAHPDESEALVRNLEGLPLAITVAGRLLHSEAQLGWGVIDLLAELETGDQLLNANVPSDMLGAVPEITPTVTTLLRRSTDLLDAQSRIRFAHLGLFVPKPATFDLEAMAAAWNVEDARPTTRVLVTADYSNLPDMVDSKYTRFSSFMRILCWKRASEHDGKREPCTGRIPPRSALPQQAPSAQ